MSDDPQIERQLLNLASDRPEVNRAAAAWFLTKGKGVAPALAAALDDVRLGAVCHWRILLVLRQLKIKSTLPAILQVLWRNDPITRPGAMEAAAVFATDEAVDALAGLINIADRDVARHAAVLLGQTRAPRAVPHLERLLTDANPEVRSVAVRALGAVGDPAAHAVLQRHLGIETDGEVREQIRAALGGSSA